eukprot:1158262-Pelagomonas_calceolata.AAC.10
MPICFVHRHAEGGEGGGSIHIRVESCTGLGATARILNRVHAYVAYIRALSGQVWEGLGSERPPGRRPTTPQQPTLPPQGHINDANVMNESKSLLMGLEGACLKGRLRQCASAITAAPACRKGGSSLLPWNDKESRMHGQSDSINRGLEEARIHGLFELNL